MTFPVMLIALMIDLRNGPTKISSVVPLVPTLYSKVKELLVITVWLQVHWS